MHIRGIEQERVDQSGRNKEDRKKAASLISKGDTIILVSGSTAMNISIGFADGGLGASW